MFTLHDTTCASYAQFSNSFFQPPSVYIGFANETKPLFYLGSSIGTVLEREHTRYRKFPQVHLGQRPCRSWSKSNRLWFSFGNRNSTFGLSDFISQFFVPKKGIVTCQAFSNSRQFGSSEGPIKRLLWSKCGDAAWLGHMRLLKFRVLTNSFSILFFPGLMTQGLNPSRPFTMEWLGMIPRRKSWPCSGLPMRRPGRKSWKLKAEE